MSFADVEKWLREQGISNYTISEDLYVSVQGSVNLNGKLNGQKLPVKFKQVDGYLILVITILLL